jgi:hypothetical protein
MQFQKFEGPFSDAEILDLRHLFCGERLMLDLIECKRTKPPEPPPPGVSEDEYYIIGPTEESRVWRLSYNRPFALRTREVSLRLRRDPEAPPPGQCCFSEKSEWIDEFVADTFPNFFVPTHYVFTMLDHVIEILADKTPEIERMENTFAG